MHPRLQPKDIYAGRKIVVRVNTPRICQAEYRRYIFGDSVTGQVPENFDYAESKDVLLGGVWQKGMDGGARRGCDYFPTMDAVNRVFDIGDMFRTFCIRDVNHDGTPVCYFLHGIGRYDLVSEDPGTALRNYLRGMLTDQKVWQSSPRVITMDEVFWERPLSEELLVPGRNGIKHFIMMDPAPVFQRAKTS